MKKQTFLLLEVLIALSLVLLCIVPLILKPLDLFRSENNLLWEMEKERLADWTFSEIKEKLLKNEIPWNQLPTEKKKEISYTLPDQTISLPGRKQKNLKRQYTLTLKREKEGPNGEVYRLFDVKITLIPPISKDEKIYKYKVMARKLCG